jgi:hypothetical protein
LSLAPPDGPPPSRWRRLGIPVLLCGALLALSPLLSKWPSTHELEVELDAPAQVTRVSLDVGPRGGDPTFATTWSFARGTAPRRLPATFSGETGRYEATVVVERDGTPSSRVHQLDLDGERRVTLFAR